jgi:hypothetical protein
MRFTALAAALIVTACAAFSAPTHVEDAELAMRDAVEPRNEPGDFEVRVFTGTSYTGTMNVFYTTGSHSFGYLAKSWLYYDGGCCVRCAVPELWKGKSADQILALQILQG